MLRDQTRRLVRFSDDVAALAKAEESAMSMSYASLDVNRLTRQCVAAAQERYDTKGSDCAYTSRNRYRRFGPTNNDCLKCWGTCWRMRYGTHRPAGRYTFTVFVTATR